MKSEIDGRQIAELDLFCTEDHGGQLQFRKIIQHLFRCSFCHGVNVPLRICRAGGGLGEIVKSCDPVKIG